jgi:hypothetical protein
MNRWEKVLVLSNEVKARLLESILKEQEIPHVLRTYHDSVYDGIYQLQKGWGHVEAPSRFAARIKRIYQDLEGEGDPQKKN